MFPRGDCIRKFECIWLRSFKQNFSTQASMLGVSCERGSSEWQYLLFLTVADHVKQLAAGVDLAEQFNKRCKEEEEVSVFVWFWSLLKRCLSFFFFVRKECEVCLCTFPLEMHVETMYWLLQSLLNPWLVQCFPFQAVTGKIYCL